MQKSTIYMFSTMNQLVDQKKTMNQFEHIQTPLMKYKILNSKKAMSFFLLFHTR